MQPAPMVAVHCATETVFEAVDDGDDMLFVVPGQATCTVPLIVRVGVEVLIVAASGQRRLTDVSVAVVVPKQR